MDVMIALDAEELSSGAEFTIEADQTELVVLTREDRPDEGLDHSGIAASAVHALRRAAVRIRARRRQTCLDILATGKDLIEAKDKLGHGKFGPWLKAEFDWSAKTAQNYMNAAREFGDMPKVAAIFPPAVLYDLSGNASLKGVRDEFVAETKAGTRIQGADIKRRIQEAKGTKTKAPGSSVNPTLSTVATGTEAVSGVGASSACKVLPSIPCEGPGRFAAGELDTSEQREEVAEKLVRILQKAFGQKFIRLQSLMLELPGDVFMQAVKNAKPLVSNGKG